MNYPAPIAHCPHCRIPLVQEYETLVHCPQCTWFMSIRPRPAKQS